MLFKRKNVWFVVNRSWSEPPRLTTCSNPKPPKKTKEEDLFLPFFAIIRQLSFFSRYIYLTYWTAINKMRSTFAFRSAKCGPRPSAASCRVTVMRDACVMILT